MCEQSPPPVLAAQPEPTPPEPIHGFPVWIRVSALIVLATMAYSLITGVSSIRVAVAMERGHRSLVAGKYQEADDQLSQVAKLAHGNVDLTLDLAEAKISDGDLPGAAECLDSLEGQEVTQEEDQRADALGDRLTDEADKLERALDVVEKGRKG